MANKFESFLSAIGKGFKKGLEVVIPFAQSATAAVSVINPVLGAALNTTIGVVLQTEQKFAAEGQQTGTGPQKLSEAMNILEPALLEIFKANGIQADTSHVQNYINAVVALLNALPAPVVSAPQTTAAAASR